MLSFDIFGTGLYIRAYPDGAFKLLSLFIYGYLCYRITDTLTWRFIRVVMIAETIIIITLAVMVVYYGRFPDVRLLFTVLTFLIYWITYKVVARSVPFREEAHVVILHSQKGPKYAHSSLKQEEADRIETELHKLMLEQKPFLDTSLTIDGVAVKLSTNRHNLSRVLNERLKKTWSDYLNQWRLEESRKRLSDPSNFRFTIAAIALDSGFNSVSSFNDVFKKRFGTTPSKFRSQFSDQMSA
jgi:AraC-like DNA-binding protein